MANRRYQSIKNRDQMDAFPPLLDDYVGQDNPVRAIDVYVDALDWLVLDFSPTDCGTGRGQPAYSAAMLLKLYLYGYLHRVRSSRRLAQETRRNLEMIWLVEHQQPSHTVIARFRADNAAALKRACRDFVELCQGLDLVGGEAVGIDGTFMHANASKASLVTETSLEKQRAQLAQSIEAYLSDLNEADQHESEALPTDPALAEKLKRLMAERDACQAQLAQMKARGEKQQSKTDPDARLLHKSGQTVAGYNLQIAVDAKHKLIVEHEVTNAGNDSGQLDVMAKRSQERLGVETLTVVADGGYYHQERIRCCVEAGITPYVALPRNKSSAKAQGRFDREAFSYETGEDVYHCPGGKTLVPQSEQIKSGKRMIRYVSRCADCSQCPLKARCLPKTNAYRSLYRWEHEAVIDAHKQRMVQAGQEKMRQRTALVEHPFGTLKCQMGWRHALVRGFEKVRGEVGLLILSYNFRRVLNLIGIDRLRAYCAPTGASRGETA